LGGGGTIAGGKILILGGDPPGVQVGAIGGGGLETPQGGFVYLPAQGPRGTYFDATFSGTSPG